MARKIAVFAKLLGIDRSGDERLQFLGEAGYMRLHQGLLEEAAALFEGITVLAPNDPVGYLGLADVMLIRCDYELAWNAARQAIRSANVDRRTMACAYAASGQALVGLGRLAEARKAWETACEMDADGGWNDQARLWLDIGARQAEAPEDGASRTGGRPGLSGC